MCFSKKKPADKNSIKPKSPAIVPVPTPIVTTQPVEPKKKEEVVVEVVKVEKKEEKKEREDPKVKPAEKTVPDVKPPNEKSLIDLYTTGTERERRPIPHGIVVKPPKKPRCHTFSYSDRETTTSKSTRRKREEEEWIREKKKVIDAYDKVKHKPLADDEEDVSVRVHTIGVDKTQKSMDEEPWYNADYKAKERPIWLMDEKHDKIADTWIKTVPDSRKEWKKMLVDLRKDTSDNIPMEAYKKNEAMNRGSVPCQDHGRVVLKFPGLNTDYIHANYVGVSTKPKRFICTQTPMANTTHAFWAMVIQEKVEQIISMDDQKEEFVKYWPLKRHEKLSFGDDPNKIWVTNVKIHGRSETITEVELKVNWPEKDERIGGRFLSIYKCTRWEKNDHRDLVLEMFRIAWNNKNPIVVHDPSGVGLAGTVIAVAYIHEIMYNGGDGRDIKGLMKKLRSQRYGLIDTFPQYYCVYKTLIRFFERECQYSTGYTPGWTTRRAKMRKKIRIEETQKESEKRPKESDEYRPESDSFSPLYKPG